MRSSDPFNRVIEALTPAGPISGARVNTPGGSGRAQPAPPRWCATDRTGKPRPADTQSAGTSAGINNNGRTSRKIVVDDRLAAIEPQRLDQLPNPLARQPRPGLSNSWISVLERIQLRRSRRPPKDRWPLRPNRPSDRIAIDPIPPGDLLDPDPGTKCSRRNSAHRSTSSTPPSPARSPRPSQGPATPGRLYPTLKGGAISTGRGG